MPRRPHTQPSRPASLAEKLLLVGLAVASFGVPLAFAPGLGSGFGPPKALVLTLGVLVALVAAVLDRTLVASAVRLVRTSRLLQVGAGLLALGAVSALASGDLRASVVGSYPDYRGLLALVAWSIVALGAAVSSARWPDAVERLLLRGSSVTLLAITAVALAEKAGLPPATMKLEGAVRTISTAGNASNLGVVCCLLVPFAVACAYAERSTGLRAAGLLGSAGGVLVAVWTLSRGGWLGLLASLAVAVALVLVAKGTGGSARSTRGGGPARPSRRLLMVGGALALALVVGVAAMPAAAPRAARLLETASATAEWRLTTWRSTLVLIGDHPLVGVGPNGFRGAFLKYKQPGADDGRLGYLPTESAHNAALDAGASFGIGGLFAAVALISLALYAAWVRARAGELMVAPALAAAVVASSVALLFHYVTLDSGSLLALVLGVSAAWPPTPPLEPSAAETPGPLRIVVIGLAASWAVVPVVAVGLLAADASAAAAVRAASSGGEWRPSAQRAAVLAPWEPAMHRAGGRAASAAARGGDRSDLDAGTAAYDRAIAATPDDPAILIEAARFHLLAAAMLGDDARIERASGLLERSAALDPASGVPLGLLGRIALARADAEQAKGLLERSVELSPKGSAAWRDLAEARRRTGDDAGALEALQRAEATDK